MHFKLMTSCEITDDMSLTSPEILILYLSFNCFSIIGAAFIISILSDGLTFENCLNAIAVSNNSTFLASLSNSHIINYLYYQN